MRTRLTDCCPPLLEYSAAVCLLPFIELLVDAVVCLNPRLIARFLGGGVALDPSQLHVVDVADFPLLYELQKVSISSSFACMYTYQPIPPALRRPPTPRAATEEAMESG